ncbi:MAG: rpfG8 [Lachnospiraceae bacterium]|jgi:diguanylate cyclase (GGDEF)-like protein/PAS domain S-box-containing protein/putative nucleotidyltransferase with HDIG domain|nr:rpfG8 [Lachnospiraceae bacterium]
MEYYKKTKKQMGNYKIESISGIPLSSRLMNFKTKEQTEFLFDFNPVPTYITSLEEGKFVKVNQAFIELFDYYEEDVIGKTVFDINIYESPEEREKIIRDLHLKGFCNNIELKLRNHSGKKIIGLYSSRTLTMGGNNYIISVLLDITKRKKIETELQKSEEKYRSLFDNAAEMICVIQDAKFKIFNSMFSELTGYTEEDTENLHYLDIISPEDREYVKAQHEDRLRGYELEKRYQFRLIRKDGTELWAEINAVKIDWEEKDAVLCFFIDVTQRKSKEMEVLYLSYHDQLTGIYNRRFYQEELRQLNNKSNLPFTIVMADVNGLKLTNDAFGHLIGDKLLKDTANILSNECREGDVAARIGGDEFVLLLPKTTSDEALLMIERIKERINEKRSGSYYLSVSFGCYTKNMESEDIDFVIMRAEDNMYRNKLTESEEIRNKIVTHIVENFFQDNPWVDRHSKAVSELSAALAKELGLDEEEIEDIKRAGFLHDIGKSAIIKDINVKTEDLTEAECLELMRHPEIGSHILKSANQYSNIAGYVLAHHENIDGSGYPKGLKGDNIPLQSRILSLADAYDNMINETLNHKALSRQEAIAKLRAAAGVRFDSNLTNIFIEKVLQEQL